MREVKHKNPKEFLEEKLSFRINFTYFYKKQKITVVVHSWGKNHPESIVGTFPVSRSLWAQGQCQL